MKKQTVNKILGAQELWVDFTSVTKIPCAPRSYVNQLEHVGVVLYRCARQEVGWLKFFDFWSINILDELLV